jgi:hypothetical protein
MSFEIGARIAFVQCVLALDRVGLIAFVAFVVSSHSSRTTKYPPTQTRDETTNGHKPRDFLQNTLPAILAVSREWPRALSAWPTQRHGGEKGEAGP